MTLNYSEAVAKIKQVCNNPSDEAIEGILTIAGRTSPGSRGLQSLDANVRNQTRQQITYEEELLNFAINQMIRSGKVVPVSGKTTPSKSITTQPTPGGEESPSAQKIKETKPSPKQLVKKDLNVKGFQQSSMSLVSVLRENVSACYREARAAQKTNLLDFFSALSQRLGGIKDIDVDGIYGPQTKLFTRDLINYFKDAPKLYQEQKTPSILRPGMKGHEMESISSDYDKYIVRSYATFAEALESRFSEKDFKSMDEFITQKILPSEESYRAKMYAKKTSNVKTNAVIKLAKILDKKYF